MVETLLGTPLLLYGLTLLLQTTYFFIIYKNDLKSTRVSSELYVAPPSLIPLMKSINLTLYSQKKTEAQMKISAGFHHQFYKSIYIHNYVLPSQNLHLHCKSDHSLPYQERCLRIVLSLVSSTPLYLCTSPIICTLINSSYLIPYIYIYIFNIYLIFHCQPQNIAFHVKMYYLKTLAKVSFHLTDLSIFAVFLSLLCTYTSLSWCLNPLYI